MILLLAGDAHGRLTRLYERAEQLAKELSIEPEWLLHVGSFGVWPDPHLAKKTSDFPRIYYRTELPAYRTLVCPGRHEDHNWLRRVYNKGQLEISPGIHRLVSGYPANISTLRVLGIEGVYSPNAYRGSVRHKQRGCYYSTSQIERSCRAGPIDILLSEEAGHGSRLEEMVSGAEGINQALFATRARLHAHAHYNTFSIYKNPYTATPTIALPYGGLVALEMTETRLRLLSPEVATL